MTYAHGKNAPFSVALYAEAFGCSAAEAKADIDALVSADAVPFSLSESGTVLTQGIGIPLWADGVIPVYYLYALATAPAARRQGFLRTLLEEVAKRAKESAYAALCLLPANDALAAAYERMGFTEHRPAGGSATPSAPSELALRFREMPVYTICHEEELRIPLGMALSSPLFSYAVSSLGEGLLPCRIGNGFAILLRDDPHCALAVSPSLSSAVQRVGKQDFLLYPLGRPLPHTIPEPLPR